MSTQSDLVLYSAWAQRLINGRKADRAINQHPIYGLLIFAKLNSVIWSDAAKQNPYALWFLSRFDEKQQAVQECLDVHSETVNDRWKSSGFNDKDPDEQVGGQVFSLLLKTPYSWKSASQIKQFDNYYQKAKQLNGLGMLNDKELHASIRQLNTLILACFNESRRYRSLSITVDNRLSGTEEAQQALTAMGEIPSEILTGSKLPEYRPTP